MWLCSCECGQKAIYRSSKLVSGLRKSCGKCTKEDRNPRDKHYRLKARRRQGKVLFSSLPIGKQLQLVYEFLFLPDYMALSKKHSVNQDSLRNGIRLFRDRLNVSHELNYMKSIEYTTLSTEVIEKALQTTFVSDTLRDMLSDDTSETLTHHEIMYCYLFVHTGSNQLALKESQLDQCLKEKSTIRLQYLGMHLRAKPNLKLYIQQLREGLLDDIKASKKLVQRELITQIEQLKETLSIKGLASDRTNLIKCIELLGRTEGAFEDKVKLEGVSAASALDQFLEMAKASVRELPSGETVDEVYSVDQPSAYQEDQC